MIKVDTSIIMIFNVFQHIQFILRTVYIIFCTLPFVCIVLFMQENPSWKANRFSASQETPRILWNPKTHYCIYNSPLPIPTLSQINLVHAQAIHVIY